MNIVETYAKNRDISPEQLKYLLWLTLIELQNWTCDYRINTVDPDETFDINYLLNVLDDDLGVLP